MGKKVAKVLGLGVLILVAVVGVAASLLLANLDNLINGFRSDIEGMATETLGRKVTFGPAKSTFDGGLFVEFSTIDLAGPTAEAQPLLHVERVRLKVALLKALVSLGKDLQVEQFQLGGPSIRIHRNAEGRWDFQDILDHLAASATPPTAEEAEKKVTDEEAYKGLRIAGMSIKDGRLEVQDDQELKRTLVVQGFSLAVSEIVPGKDASANLDFAIVDGPNTAPFHLDTQVRPIPATLDFSVLPMTSTHLTLKDLDLTAWGNLVPAGVIRPAQGKVSVQLAAETNRGATDALAQGFVEVKGLVLAQGKARGQPSDLRLDLDAGGDIANVKFDVRKLDIVAPSLTLKTRVKVESADAQGIKDANIELRVAQLERVLAVLPPGTAALPKELTLEGPFEVDVKGDATGGNLRVDLDNAHLAWADQLDKRAGTPLNLKVKALKAGDRVKLPSIALELDTAKLGGNADVSTRKGAPMMASLDTGPVTLASLKGILPPLQKALAQKGKVDGTFRLQADAKDAAGKQEAHARLELRGVDVKLAQTLVKGEATLAADASPNGETITASLEADLDPLEVRQVDDKKEAVFTKKAGFPLGLSVKVVKNPTNAVIEKADVRMGKTRVSARGRADNLDKASPTLDIKVDTLDVAFDDVRAAVPAASALPAGGHLYASVAVTGDPNEQRSLSVDVKGLKVTAAKNIIEGQASVKDLSDPDINVDLTKVDLNFDELRKLAKNDAIPQGGILKARVKAEGRPNKLHTMKVAVEDLDTTIYNSRVQGYARIQDLDRPNFDIKLTGDKLDINSLIAQTKGDKKEEKPKEPEVKSDNEHGLSSTQRALVKRFNGKADVRVGKVLYDAYELNKVTAVARMQQGVLTFDELSFLTLGGSFKANGTSLDLGAEYLGSNVKVDIDSLDLDKLLGVAANKKGLMAGRVSLSTALTTRGMTGKDLAKSLEGPLELNSKEVTLAGFNLMGGVMDRVGKVVPFVKAVGPAAVLAKQPTGLKDLLAKVQFSNGKVVLPKPAVARTPFGDLSMEGSGDWDKKLNLVGTLDISPDTVAGMTGGKIRPKNSVKTPVRIGGTTDRPVVEGVDVEAFLKNAGVPDVAGAIKEAAEEAHRKMEEEARKAQEEADRIKREAEARMQAEKQRMEDEARKRADEAKKVAEDARKRAEDEARKRTDDAKKQAEQARKRAEDEARKKTDEAKKKAEDEAKKKTDEAKKQAEKGLKNLFK